MSRISRGWLTKKYRNSLWGACFKLGDPIDNVSRTWDQLLQLPSWNYVKWNTENPFTSTCLYGISIWFSDGTLQNSLTRSGPNVTRPGPRGEGCTPSTPSLVVGSLQSRSMRTTPPSSMLSGLCSTSIWSTLLIERPIPVVHRDNGLQQESREQSVCVKSECCPCPCQIGAHKAVGVFIDVFHHSWHLGHMMVCDRQLSCWCLYWCLSS